MVRPSGAEGCRVRSCGGGGTTAKINLIMLSFKKDFKKKKKAAKSTRGFHWHAPSGQIPDQFELVSEGQPVLVLLEGTDCRAQGVYQMHPHAHTPVSRGEDLREATQSISLQIRLITFQRGPVNSPDGGC